MVASRSPAFKAEGHFYTAGYVALMAGYRDIDKLVNISCYTQTPDEELVRLNAVPVSFYGFVPGFWTYRHRVVDGLHSLHGGDAEETKKRRDDLKKMIVAAVQPNSGVSDWQLGFLIHAFGDSYAHVHGDPVEAYGPLFGHAFASLTGDDPDALFINHHYENYNEYVRELFDALSRGEISDTPNQTALLEFTNDIEAEGAKGESADKTVTIHIRRGAAKAYGWELNEETCKALNSGLDNEEVRAFLKKLSSDLDA